MIPVLARVRAKSLEEFGELVRHAGEEYTHVLEGRVAVHTEFYDPIVLTVGQSVYIDSNMGHAYIAGEGCEEAVVLSVCSSAEESLMESLLKLHAEDNGVATFSARRSERVRDHHRKAREASAPPSGGPTL